LLNLSRTAPDNAFSPVLLLAIVQSKAAAGALLGVGLLL
jgi:hypothetical protein